MEIDFSPNIRPLFPFNVIFDTDFGLIRLIRDEYADDKVFDLDVLNLPDDELKEVLVKRTHVNPLIVCMKKFDNETALEYYTEQLQTVSYNITNNKQLENYAKVVARSGLKIPKRIINANKDTRERFLNYLNKYLTKEVNIQNFSKTFVAGYNFIQC